MDTAEFQIGGLAIHSLFDMFHRACRTQYKEAFLNAEAILRKQL